MENLLLPDQRKPELFYDVYLQGEKEKTTSIRGGIAWPQADAPGYLIMVAQLEKKDRDGSLRFLAFAEDQAALMKGFFEKIALACLHWPVDALCHGDGPGEQDYSRQLYDYLETRQKRYEIRKMPQIGPTGMALENPWMQRRKKIAFLTQLLRDHIANHTLLFFQASDGRTPLLLDKVRHTDLEANPLEVAEIKALAFVMDDFSLAPWIPPEHIEKDDY
ncbi:MAG: hypothetical protein R6T98_08300 [Desulfatiglandales bacterium]